MLYNVLVGFVFAQLHYITKKAASLLFSGCSLFFCFFTAPFVFFNFFANFYTIFIYRKGRLSVKSVLIIGWGMVCVGYAALLFLL